ncbi:SH3 domain-containing protein [Aquimarina rubra]|uniref:SH3 domain-containing protein n=1 Tax=Aquimarina rubra TaxID=1920033 RepID=A0ABW5LA03_9FLAO
MKYQIKFLIIFITLLSCKDKNQRITDYNKSINISDSVVEIDRKIPVNKKPTIKYEKEYFYTIADRLSLREKPSVNSKRIAILRYLEPIEIIENLIDKTETVIDKEDGEINGNWVKIKLLNGQIGYAFNGYIKSLKKLSSKLKPKGIDDADFLINGKLKAHTSLKRLLNYIGKPDSIRSFNVVKDDYSYKIKRKYKNGILYIIEDTDQYFELGDGGWIYQDFKVKFYYKNGIEYEELNGEVGFVSIDFKIKNNYLEYSGMRIDNSTSYKEICKLFPIQAKKEDCKKGFKINAIRSKHDYVDAFYILDLENEKPNKFYFYWYD